MPNGLDPELQAAVNEIDSGLRPGVWVHIIGSYIRVEAIRQNMLSEDVIANTAVALEDFSELEDGRKCVSKAHLLELLKNLRHRDLAKFLRDAYDTVHVAA